MRSCGRHRTVYHQEQSKLEALTNITERYDGYGGSVKKVMEQKEKEKGIIGVVADIIQGREANMRPLSRRRWAEVSRILYTDNEETAKHMIRFLKAEPPRKSHIPSPDQYYQTSGIQKSRGPEGKRCHRYGG